MFIYHLLLWQGLRRGRQCWPCGDGLRSGRECARVSRSGRTGSTLAHNQRDDTDAHKRPTESRRESPSESRTTAPPQPIRCSPAAVVIRDAGCGLCISHFTTHDRSPPDAPQRTRSRRTHQGNIPASPKNEQRPTEAHRASERACVPLFMLSAYRGHCTPAVDTIKHEKSPSDYHPMSFDIFASTVAI